MLGSIFTSFSGEYILDTTTPTATNTLAAGFALKQGQKAQFKSRMSHVGMVLKNGKQCNFINHTYLTDNIAEVMEIAQEVLAGNPQFYVDPDQPIVDTRLQDAIREAQAQAAAAVIRQFEAAGSVLPMANAQAMGSATQNIAVSQAQAQASAQGAVTGASSGPINTSPLATVGLGSIPRPPVDPNVIEDSDALNAFAHVSGDLSLKPPTNVPGGTATNAGEPSAQSDANKLGDISQLGQPAVPTSISTSDLKAKLANLKSS